MFIKENIAKKMVYYFDKVEPVFLHGTPDKENFLIATESWEMQ